jgi:glutathione S-transferase
VPTLSVTAPAVWLDTPRMAVRLYSMALSHPSQAVRQMLELKGVEYKLVGVFPFNQRIHMRLAGFRGGTVPGVKLDGRRVQGSREIARVLDELWPEPPLFPADPELCERVEEAERWGEEQLQPVPRRIGRYGAVHEPEVLRWGAQVSRLPAASVIARIAGPMARYYARTIEVDGRRATDASVRADLEALPALLDHVDRLLADGTLATDPPNAATLQVLSSICLLDALSDLHDLIAERPCTKAARQLFPDYPSGFPRFLEPEWLEPLRPAQG